MNWWKNSNVRFNEPLKDKTTFKIGGAAKFFCRPKDTAELKLLIIAAKRYKIPVFIIGSGSNILINDKGINGLVLKLDSGSFKQVVYKRNYLDSGSGLALAELIRVSIKAGLSGLEFLSGIPGTVGGALCMNAGAGGISIGDFVQEVRVMDRKGSIKILHKKDISFGYRSSSLAGYIILSGRLKLVKKNKEEIKNNVKKYLDYRRNTQDTAYPGAGCIFKNPLEGHAGRLIDSCGLKGRKQGGACISLRHANFILNQNEASACDVLKLMSIIRKKVKQKFEIDLEPEIKIWR